VRRGGALVIDTRAETQRAEAGELPGAIVIDRTVLEWRLDPTADTRIPELLGAYSPPVDVTVRSRRLAADPRSSGTPAVTSRMRMGGPGASWRPAGVRRTG